MSSRRRLAGRTIACLIIAAACRAAPTNPPAPSAATVAAITPHDLELRLAAFAADSMMGREAGTIWNAKATDYVAAQFRQLGLRPAGDSGSFFQVVPGIRVLDTTARFAPARNVVAVVPRSRPRPPRRVCVDHRAQRSYRLHAPSRRPRLAPRVQYRRPASGRRQPLACAVDRRAGPHSHRSSIRSAPSTHHGSIRCSTVPTTTAAGPLR